MMTTTKPEHSDRQKEEFVKGKLRRNPILWFILASMLVHGVGSVMFVLVKRSQPVVPKNAKPTPIDFIVVPPEETPTEEPNKPAANTLPQGENQPGKAIEPEPEPPTPEKTEPVAPSQAVAVPKPVTPPPKPKPPQAIKPKPVTPPKTTETKAPEPKPEPVTPPPVANAPTEKPTTSEILTGSDLALEKPKKPEAIEPPTNITKPEKTSPTETTATQTTQTPEPKKPSTDASTPEDTSVATRLPPKITPTQPESSATPPAAENQIPPTETGAASLLGGGIKRSLEDDGGESFFDLETDATQQAYNPALLDEQQSIDMRKYFSEIQRRVRRNWNPNGPMEEYTTVLNFTVQSNGQITGLKVFQSSGSAEIDREALEAVQNSGPFAPLPESFPLDSVNIGFNFNIYIY